MWYHFCVVPPKEAQPEYNHEETADKIKLTNIMQTIAL
jgi:hypothetical protein